MNVLNAGRMDNELFVELHVLFIMSGPSFTLQYLTFHYLFYTWLESNESVDSFDLYFFYPFSSNSNDLFFCAKIQLYCIDYICITFFCFCAIYKIISIELLGTKKDKKKCLIIKAPFSSWFWISNDSDFYSNFYQFWSIEPPISIYWSSWLWIRFIEADRGRDNYAK